MFEGDVDPTLAGAVDDKELAEMLPGNGLIHYSGKAVDVYTIGIRQLKVATFIEVSFRTVVVNNNGERRHNL